MTWPDVAQTPACMARPRIPPVPNRIAELRKAAGLSQKALGVIVGLEQSQIGKIERGQSGLQDYQVDLFAKALKVQPWEVTEVGPQRRRLLLDIFEQLPPDKQSTLLTLGRALAETPTPYGEPPDDQTQPGERRRRRAA